ncbi:unknown similar to AMEV128 [Choristoneura rosaceana entomopoxvirus 'L']|uniref:Leucine rich repeat gene family n=1 Tax=Choristoneura rosaceana entomopoxvirus 'L' TaxID=1293539 RepID=A0ABM9QKI9_9POXV|nr:unknown similar to AMEV128 [Choristoneura rosaceana entomopoxvirus 'L']CCU56050.1 unknown similar to AMEV128 [Choristoneura rosaceana entomopoxvirus 'L']
MNVKILIILLLINNIYSYIINKNKCFNEFNSDVWNNTCNKIYKKTNLYICYNPAILYNITYECNKIISNWSNKHFNSINVINTKSGKKYIKLYKVNTNILRLTNNNIVNIKFYDDIYINKLYLDGNNISKITVDNKNNTSIEYLFLNNSGINNKIFNNLTSIPNLKFLDLQNNSINYLNLTYYNTYYNHVKIDISYNNIDCNKYIDNANIINKCVKTFTLRLIMYIIILLLVVFFTFCIIYAINKYKAMKLQKKNIQNHNNIYESMNRLNQ